MKILPWIYTDFSNVDSQGRVWLNTLPARRQLDRVTDLAEGMTVRLNAPRKFNVDATLVFDHSWLAVPDYDTIRYYDCTPLFERRGEIVSKAEVLEYHCDDADPAPTCSISSCGLATSRSA